jgi:6-phosphogluconolactonase
VKTIQVISRVKFNGVLFGLLSLLLIVPLLSVRSHAKRTAASKQSFFVYVGTYTGPTSQGIYVFRWGGAPRAGSIALAAGTVNPSFLAQDPSGRFLYAVNEVSTYEGQKSGAISSFSIDGRTGELEFLNQVSSKGTDPCYVTLDKTGKYVLVANYSSGTVAVFPRRPDGKLGEATAVVQHTGHGPDLERQEGPHAHQIELTKDNRFAVAADLGLDELLVYRFHPADGTLEANRPAFAQLDPGSGPRHFAFTPDGKFAYVLAEMGSTVTAFGFDASTGTFDKLQTLSSVPKDFQGHKEAAEIAVHPSGRFVYASNRGDDSIVVFAIGAQGRLTFVERVPTQGKTPRGFAIDPTGSYLLVANQDSDNVVVFAIDLKTGRLDPTGTILNVPTPVALEFVRSE